MELIARIADELRNWNSELSSLFFNFQSWDSSSVTQLSLVEPPMMKSLGTIRENKTTAEFVVKSHFFNGKNIGSFPGWIFRGPLQGSTKLYGFRPFQNCPCPKIQRDQDLFSGSFCPIAQVRMEGCGKVEMSAALWNCAVIHTFPLEFSQKCWKYNVWFQSLFQSFCSQ